MEEHNHVTYIILLTMSFLVVTLAVNDTCEDTCPKLFNVNVEPPLPEDGTCYNDTISYLVITCPVGQQLELLCPPMTTSLNGDLYCAPADGSLPNCPPPTPCPDPQNDCPPPSTPCPDPPPSSSDTVLIVIIVVLALVLVLSWAAFISFICLRNTKSGSAKEKKKQIGNVYAPTPQKSKAKNNNKNAEKMSMSYRPPLPNPRPGSTTEAQQQDEYAYIDPKQIPGNPSPDYLEVMP
ncbi:uncharacterized protein [Antedon mediterranea]|uniref:uncharacterized protein isoform X2 n=1 Tax=Antedon mediterranea TaxID=105859 RepID=UPI003AF65629